MSQNENNNGILTKLAKKTECKCKDRKKPFHLSYNLAEEEDSIMNELWKKIMKVIKKYL